MFETRQKTKKKKKHRENLKNTEKTIQKPRRDCGDMSLACKRAAKFPALHNNIIKGRSAISLVPRSPFSGTAPLKYRITEIQRPPAAEVWHKTNAMDSVTIWSSSCQSIGIELVPRTGNGQG
ncbi:uncharacterized protein Dyak_GE28537 [Drosophila yakuba]|uniref:Uncharacterized protein n=1 Tax=Drosophila yakuba TaxID=7245 RepID=A0A0R1DPG5_DROYA|nr:uncharacterized protein Dyak_GE28537 [Drosophila yakuba]